MSFSVANGIKNYEVIVEFQTGKINFHFPNACSIEKKEQLSESTIPQSQRKQSSLEAQFFQHEEKNEGNKKITNFSTVESNLNETNTGKSKKSAIHCHFQNNEDQENHFDDYNRDLRSRQGSSLSKKLNEISKSFDYIQKPYSSQTHELSQQMKQKIDSINNSKEKYLTTNDKYYLEKNQPRLIGAPEEFQIFNSQVRKLNEKQWKQITMNKVFNKLQKYKIEMEIIKTKEGKIIMGMLDKKKQRNGTLSANNENFVCYDGKSARIISGENSIWDHIQGEQPFQQGDVIVMRVNPKKGTIRWFKNGKQKGKIYSAILKDPAIDLIPFWEFFHEDVIKCRLL